jgi:hypothetical protein
MVIILLVVSFAAYLANSKSEFYLLLALAETTDVGISEHTWKVCNA